MNLDDKLREILINCYELVDVEGGPWQQGSMKVLAVKDEAIAQIKQAFADGGYRPAPFYDMTPPSKESLQKLINAEHGLMTGQEWYDRFELEFRKFAIFPDPNPLELVKIESVDWAAKKAAGL